METKKEMGDEEEGQLFVWQGYTGKVELISFTTFLSRPVRRVSLGGEHSLFLTYDDCLYSCGNNDHGQLGVPSLGLEYSFDPCLLDTLSGKSVTGIACGQSHSGCVCQNGDVYCWGDNQLGQSGTTESNSVPSPALVDLVTPAFICHHGVETPERRDHGHQLCMGSTHTVALSREGAVWVWGSGVQLGIGDGVKTPKPVIVRHLIGKKVLNVYCGDSHTMAIIEETEPTLAAAGSRSNVRSSSSVSGRSGSGSTSPGPSPCKQKVKIHPNILSSCAKCNEDICKFTENGDKCKIHEDHYCKDDNGKSGKTGILKGVVSKTSSDKVIEKPYSDKNVSANSHPIETHTSAQSEMSTVTHNVESSVENMSENTNTLQTKDSLVPFEGREVETIDGISQINNEKDGADKEHKQVTNKVIDDEQDAVKYSSNLDDRKDTEIVFQSSPSFLVRKYESEIEGLGSTETEEPELEHTAGPSTTNITVADVGTTEVAALDDSKADVTGAAASNDEVFEQTNTDQIGTPTEMGHSFEDSSISTVIADDTENKNAKSDDENNSVDAEIDLRKKVVNADTDKLTLSLRSDTSLASGSSGQFLHSKNFLDGTGAREFLARQFQQDDSQELTLSGTHVHKVEKSEPEKPLPSPVSPSYVQTVTSLASHMTSQMTSITTKAMDSISSVTGRLRPSSPAIAESSTPKSSTETLEASDRESGSNESLSVENITLEMSNLSCSDLSANMSVISLPDSETSFTVSDKTTPHSTPAKRREQNQSPVRQGKEASKDKHEKPTTIVEVTQSGSRARALTLGDDDEVGKKPKFDRPLITMDTEVWCWGKNPKGQLGLGDMIDRSEPTCIQLLTGKRIVKLAIGSQHALALTSTGEVYSWGLNASGQLGHSEATFTPQQIQLTYDCCVWDMDAGSNHSVFLMDTVGTQGDRPQVFYVGKHPCKDLYVPIYKTPRLTPLKFVKKAGWTRSVMTGGDNCACLCRQDSPMTSMLFEVSRHIRRLYRHLHNVVNVYIKRLQISGFFTSLDVSPYKPMMGRVLNAFVHLTEKIGIASCEITSLFHQGESILTAAVFTRYDVFIREFEKYLYTYCDMLAVGGFEYCAKHGSSTFENLKDFYREILPGTKTEDKPNHTEKFRCTMNLPLASLKDLSAMMNRFADIYDKSSKENHLMSNFHLNWEHLIRKSTIKVTSAENTRDFWEMSHGKLGDSLKMPLRRLIKESKTSPLSSTSAGRFSSHVFYLFNDMFIHSQYSGYQSYPLETVWVDTPTSDSSNQQNVIVITTPEETLVLTAPTATAKVEWHLAMTTAINHVISKQKSLSRQLSSDRIGNPVIRRATHTFMKHTVYKDATYKGYWLNGKVHGSGVMKWIDGRRYVGKFKHGSITGYGKLVLPKEGGNEEIQEGTWKDGKLHGHGKIRKPIMTNDTPSSPSTNKYDIYKYSNGDLYEGYFKDYQRHGHGVYQRGRYLNSASFVYVGEWMGDRKHGYGVMDDILKGEKYMGMWQDDNRHGDGVVVTLDGMYFEGNFQHSKLVGNGLMLTDDNSCYEGEFSGITLLQGKGVLTFPSGDKIEGLFNGTWNQGLKINGTFIKSTVVDRRSPSLEGRSGLYGKLCVKPDRKWEEIFYHCCEGLQYSGHGEANAAKAWDAVVAAIVAGKNRLKDRIPNLTAGQKIQLSILEQLEKIPPHSVDTLTIEQYIVIREYLTKAFDTHFHPLGHLIDGLVDVFRAAYVGIGAHPRLLYHAVQEILSYIRRICTTIRILFPELPKKGGPIQIYPEQSRRASNPVSEQMGFLQRQISEVDDEGPAEIMSATGLLQPILLPKIYPALFDLYALHCEKEDDVYWERIQKLNKQGDMSLMAYLGIDQRFWCIEEEIFKDERKRLSTLKDHCYCNSVEVLQQISTEFCPQTKLEVIQKTFLSITQAVQESYSDDHLWCMDDLFPIFQFVVVRARIHHLGAEIHFIDELMESYLEYGELGIMFTTLKACYYQIQNEKIPIH